MTAQSRRRGTLRKISYLAGIPILLSAALLGALELKLSGPFGMSGYVLYRTLRTSLRDLTIPRPPSIDGFSNTGPNVVVIVLDCYRYDYLHGAAPNLSDFGERAWRFDRYYSSAPWTKPSTVSLFTGLMVRKHYVMKGGGSQLPEEAVTIAELMKERGLRTAGFVWNPHLTRRQAFDQGFDFYVDDARHGSKSLLYEFFSWLARERPERFFAYVHFQGTHDPYYDDNDLLSLVSAPAYPGEVDFSNMAYKRDVQEGRRLTAEESSHLKHIAEGLARRVDRQVVSEFLDRFESSELPDNTMLMITSDHGDQFFEHDSVSHGSSVYDEEVHVPLMIRFPRQFAQERSFPEIGREPCPTSTVDILPTVLDFVGAPVPPGLDGISLVPGGSRDTTCSRAVISEKTIPAGGIPSAALVWKNLKLIANYEDGRNQVFDLGADPRETRDLSGEQRQQGAALAAELTRLLNSDGSSMAPWSEVDGELPEAQMEALRALGYLD